MLATGIATMRHAEMILVFVVFPALVPRLGRQYCCAAAMVACNSAAGHSLPAHLAGTSCFQVVPCMPQCEEQVLLLLRLALQSACQSWTQALQTISRTL